MMTTLSHLLEAFPLAAVAAALMIYAGIGKHALEFKRGSRTCPSCGRTTRTCRCVR